MKPKLVLKVILCVSLVLQSSFAFAETPTAFFMPVDSFIDCQELLAKAKVDQFEIQLANSLHSREDVLSVMNEANLIAGESARTALFAALADHGFSLEPDPERKTKTLFQINRDAKKIVKMNDDQWSQFTTDYLNHLVLTTAGNTQASKAQAQVAHLQISRLVSAIEQSPQRPEFVRWVKALAIATTIDLAKARLNDQFAPKINSLRNEIQIATGLIGLLAGLLFGLHFTANTGNLFHFALKLVVTGMTGIIGFGLGSLIAVPDRLFALRYGEYSMNNENRKQTRDAYYRRMREVLAGAKQEVARQSTALRLAEIRQMPNLNALTPQQIAYVGKVDLLEIQAEAATAEITLNSLDSDNTIREKVKQAANEVIARPDSNEAVLKFSDELQNYILTLELQTLAINEQVKAMSTTVNELRTDYLALKQRAAVTAARRQSQMLLDAMESELGGLESLRIQRQVQNQMIAELQAHLADLENIASQVINFDKPSVAQTQAEETLLAIEKFISLRK